MIASATISIAARLRWKTRTNGNRGKDNSPRVLETDRPRVRRTSRQPHNVAQCLYECPCRETATLLIPRQRFGELSFGFRVKNYLPVHSVRRRSSARAVSQGTVL